MEFTIREINKFSFIGKDVCFYIDKKDAKSILQNLDPTKISGASARSVYFWKNSQRPIPAKHLLNLAKSRKLRSIRIDSLSTNGGNKIILPKKIGIKFYYLLGLILGDGCLSFNKKINGGAYMLQITTRTKSEAFKVRAMIFELFKVKSSIYKSIGCYNVSCFSKTLFLLLNKRYSIPIGKKYSTMKVPDLIYKSKTAMKYFVRGVFDSDGNVYTYKNKKAIQLRQHSKRFLCEVHQLFKELGVHISGPYYDKANDSWLLWSSKYEVVKSFFKYIYPNDIGPVAQLG